MNKVAKLIITDSNDKYLMMYRNAHPDFGDDPDLPGGTLEDGEEPLQTMVREVYEEAGIIIDVRDVQKIYEGTTYSRHHTHYSLYAIRLQNRPKIVISWEHSTYEWLSQNDFLKKAKNAKDTYMHMVYAELTKRETM